jgi:hypothetical protein
MCEVTTGRSLAGSKSGVLFGRPGWNDRGQKWVTITDSSALATCP